MENTTPYVPFPKIARLSREIVISEKIDGTNGLIEIVDANSLPPESGEVYTQPKGSVAVLNDLIIYAGSRTQYITPEKDNYGFAAWVKSNAEDLVKLGVGRHFGEWWGQGIQRKYGMTEKAFSLFNVSKWNDTEARPVCCRVVPTLAMGIIFSTEEIQKSLDFLRENGSQAAPGFTNPEGIIIYHTQGNLYFKKTLDKDEEWKGKQL